MVYIDDIVITGPSLENITALELFLHGQFKLKDSSYLKYFFGLEVAHSSKGIILSQRHYALHLLEDTGFLASKLASVPTDLMFSLNFYDGDLLSNATHYKRLIGRLLYLTLSRLDITFVVLRLSQFLSKPRLPHLQVAHHLLRYIKSCPSQSISFASSSSM